MVTNCTFTHRKTTTSTVHHGVNCKSSLFIIPMQSSSLLLMNLKKNFSSLCCLFFFSYTVEEGEHLQGLITAAKATGINFYYALSPGLDITYSSLKDTATLKRKLDQVSQFGCRKLSLLTPPTRTEFKNCFHRYRTFRTSL